MFIYIVRETMKHTTTVHLLNWTNCCITLSKMEVSRGWFLILKVGTMKSFYKWASLKNSQTTLKVILGSQLWNGNVFESIIISAFFTNLKIPTIYGIIWLFIANCICSSYSCAKFNLKFIRLKLVSLSVQTCKKIFVNQVPKKFFSNLHILENRRSALDEDLRFLTKSEPKKGGTVTFDEKGTIS